MAVTQIDSNNLQPTFQLGHPTITNVQVTNSSYVVVDDTAVSTSGGYIKITGSMFNSGVQVYIGSILATSISIVSSTVLNVQVPATAAGSYDLIVVNTNGTYCIKPIGITFSPINITWVTSSSLGPYITGVAISLQLNATGATGYQLQSGSTLPTGLTLTSGGLLSGTVTVVSDTTYSFTIEAYDSELQDAPRTFSLSVLSSAMFSVEYLVIAGGGGGGDAYGAGGGAGGYLSGTFTDVNTKTYSFTIGAGGGLDTSGSNSSAASSGITTITSIGGGFGGKYATPANGGSGGSGGGGASGSTVIGAGGAGTVGPPRQGYNGGGAAQTGGYASGGGGGAGATGGTVSGTGSSIGGGAGGTGLNWLGLGTFYAGGGGGWGYDAGGGGGAGGAGGGGRGESYPSGTASTAGTVNTGGGGGGDSSTGKAGGSGVVIIRYPDSNPAATSTTGSPTITVAGGYRVYQFTGSGSITF
jgi:hypothetical protein